MCIEDRYGTALRVLSCYHPAEPEMWLTLSAQVFPHFFMGGTMKSIVAPWPGMPQKPGFVERHEQCPWRGGLTLLQYLRRSNEAGHIIHWLRKAHAASGEDISL